MCAPVLCVDTVVETLLNLHAAPRRSSLGRLADVLSRIDNLSHVLCWARGDAKVMTTQADKASSKPAALILCCSLIHVLHVFARPLSVR